MKVLIVDDNEDDALLIERSINAYRQKGCLDPVEYTKILGGYVELDAALKTGPDVIVLDYVFPGSFSWPESLHHIRQLTPVPIILVSGIVRDEIGLEAMRSGAQDYISKDDMDRLGKAVWQAWQVNQARLDQARAADGLIEAINKRESANSDRSNP